MSTGFLISRVKRLMTAYMARDLKRHGEKNKSGIKKSGSKSDLSRSNSFYLGLDVDSINEKVYCTFVTNIQR